VYISDDVYESNLQDSSAGTIIVTDARDHVMVVQISTKNYARFL
jgi:hypothetical protein